MPVLDHPTHEKTIGGLLYGCHNRTREWKAGLVTGSRVNNWARWPDSMSKECRYDQSLSDPKCTECKHAGSGEAYAERIGSNGV